MHKAWNKECCDFTNRTCNEQSFTTFISSNEAQFNWTNTVSFLRNLSQFYFKQMDTQIGKGLCDSITDTVKLYQHNFTDGYIIMINSKTENKYLPPLHNMTTEFINLHD